MRAIINKMGHFLVTNTVWVFLTVIAAISFLRIMLAKEGMVYLEAEKWQLYGQFIIGHTILFLPVLLFSFFRKVLQKHLSKLMLGLLWGYCFIGHGFLLFRYNIAHVYEPLRAQIDTPVIFGLALLLAELIIQFNHLLLQRLKLKDRLQKWSIEKTLFALVILFAFYWTYATTEDEVLFSLSTILSLLKWFLVFFACYTFYWVNHYLLIDQVFKKKGIFYYLFSFLGLAIIFLPIAAILIKNVHFQIWHLEASKWVPSGERATPFHVFPNYLPWLWMLGSIPLILIYQWWKQKNDITILEKEKSANELNALKQQVNPHFLFNTLNTLYALGIEEESEKTADGIAKLGTLMRYNLNDAQKEFISLNKEIDYIKKYIELQELRITSNNELRINLVQGNLDKYEIAPLLLIPFIENAFKYGISTTEKTFLKLDITIHDNFLRMELVNTIINQKEAKSSTGIGLSNTRKRLAALYPQQYELIIEEMPTEFEVHLEIKLA